MVNAVILADGITGNSTIETNAIQVFSYSFGASISHSLGVSANDSRGGSPNLSDLNIMKALDATSPYFFEKMLKSSPIKTLSLKYFKNINDTNAMYIEYKMTNAYITSIQQSGSSENPTESLSFNFDQIEFSYYKEKTTNDGVELETTKGYNIRTNTTV